MGTLKIVINHLVIYFIYEFLLRSLYVLLICLVLSEMLAAEEMNSNREMLNPLNPAGKQQLPPTVFGGRGAACRDHPRSGEDRRPGCRHPCLARPAVWCQTSSCPFAAQCCWQQCRRESSG